MRFVPLLVILLLAACGVAKPIAYEAKSVFSPGPGYVDLGVSETEARVLVYGNALSSPARMERVGLARLAELTFGKGRKRFKVTDRKFSIRCSYQNNALLGGSPELYLQGTYVVDDGTGKNVFDARSTLNESLQALLADSDREVTLYEESCRT